MDQCTTALASAWLFQLSLKHNLWGPGQDLTRAEALRRAIAKACHSQGVKPLEAAVSTAFREAKGTLTSFAAKFTSRTDSDEKNMAKAINSLESEEEDELKGLTQKLSSSLSETPDSHIERLVIAYREALTWELANPPETVA